MKIALFVLGVLAFAQGIHLEDDSSMTIEFDYEEDEPGSACVVDCDRQPQRNFCQGFAEIRSEFNGRERVHVRINKSTSSRSIQLEEGSSIYVEFDNEEDWAGRPLDGWITKASILKYRPTGGRNARKIIEVQGNCCWRFYQR